MKENDDIPDVEIPGETEGIRGSQRSIGGVGSVNSGASVSSGPGVSQEDTINFINFNQDASYVLIGTNTGYKIFNCGPTFGKCYQWKKYESVGIVEMLYTTSLVAVVMLGEEVGSSPRKLKIINTKRQSTISDLIFPNTILQVKLTRHRLVVVLESQIYIYDIGTLKLLHTIETSANPTGLCTISNDETNCVLAYPSPPRTIPHDSLLVAGINTNGGVNLVQNNIQSVSNTPNRIGDVIIFNLNTLQPVSVIEAHKATLASMALSGDGTLLATASDKGTIVRIFSVDTGIKLYQFRRGTYSTKIWSLRFSADNKYVVATSSSETVHIFRLGEDERLKANSKKVRVMPNLSRVPELEITPIKSHDSQKQDALGAAAGVKSLTSSTELDEEIVDDDDDSDEEDEELEPSSVPNNKQRKLSEGSFTSVNSAMSDDKVEPVVDQNRLSVARLIRRLSQSLGRRAAQRMGDFLPSKFSSILEPIRHFASLKINSSSKDTKSIAVINSEIQQDIVPQSYVKDHSTLSPEQREGMQRMNLLHVHVVTSDGTFYVFGLDPERGGDCILLRQYSLLEEGG